MKKIEVSELTENFFETISKEWMLVCAGDANRIMGRNRVVMEQTCSFRIHSSRTLYF